MKRKKATISGVVKYVLLSVYAMVTVFPLFWTFANSFRTNNQIFSTTVLLPESFTYLVNYTNILKENILGAYWNSFSLTVTTLVIMLLCVIPAAFLMSQYRFHLSKALQNLFVVGIIIPRLAILITTFQNFNTFGFLNHKYPITLMYEPFKEFITMAFLLVGNIPLLYFLNKDWYDVLVNTGFGKGILAVCLLVLLISFAAVIRLTKPVEYKR